MALQSVTSPIAVPTANRGSIHDLWVGADHVLTVSIDKNCREFPPHPQHVTTLNNMIRDLARATKAVIFHAENDTTDSVFAMGPLEGIADAIILLSQVSSAVQHELDRSDAAKDG